MRIETREAMEMLFTAKWNIPKAAKHGQGTYIQSEGRKYVGEYKNGLKNGLGALTYGKGKWEGDKYVGEFKIWVLIKKVIKKIAMNLV